MPFVIKKNPIEKGALGSRPAEITFFKQAAVESFFQTVAGEIR